MRYVDIDDLIVTQIQMPIAQYVAEHGWKQFRQVEHEVTRMVAKRRNTIIATGGGTLLFKRNLALLHQGYILLVYAPVRELQRRIAADVHTQEQRPALHTSSPSANAVREVAAVWRDRKESYYSIADAVYDSRYSS